MWFITFFALLAVALAAGPNFGRVCKPGEKGSPGIKYYLDSERNDTPYPFQYLGCGGKFGEYFDKKEQAYQMLHKDGVFCNGFGEHKGVCGNVPLRPGQKPGDECPAGHFCLNGPHFGICCSQAVSDRYDKNRKALKCPKGSKGAVKDPEDKDSFFFGKSCAHKFCPKNSKCVQEEFEAYCCL